MEKGYNLRKQKLYNDYNGLITKRLAEIVWHVIDILQERNIAAGAVEKTDLARVSKKNTQDILSINISEKENFFILKGSDGRGKYIISFNYKLLRICYMAVIM